MKLNNNFENQEGPPMSTFGGPSFGSKPPLNTQGNIGTPPGMNASPKSIPGMGGGGFGAPSGNSGFGSPKSPLGAGGGGFGAPSGNSGFGAPSGNSGFGSPKSPPNGSNNGFGSVPKHGIPKPGFGTPMQQPNESPKKEFIPLNKELQTSRENSVKKFTSTLFGSMELLPLLVGTVNPVPFTRTLTILSSVICGANILYGTILGYDTLLHPLQTILPVAFNGIWYIYSRNKAEYEEHSMDKIIDSLPDLPTPSEPIEQKLTKEPLIKKSV